ncbi:MAG: hypothetical protein ACHQHO_08830 [Solirubrobacterales bacterium]
MGIPGRNHYGAVGFVVLAAATLTWGAAPAAAACGQDYHATPAHSDIPGGAPLAIGDSVLADAVPLLVRDGFEADGMVCRQMGQGLALLRARGPALPHLIVLALGTNGDVTAEQIDAALAIVGPGRTLALVVPHGSVAPSSPKIIRAAAAAHPRRVLLLDWDRLVAAHPDWLAPDGVHLGGSAGIAAFAQMIAGVLPYATTGSTEAEATVDPGTPITIQPPPGHRNEAGATASAGSTESAPGRSSGGWSRSVLIPLRALGAFLATVAAPATVAW